jgi:peptidoglycan/LPS O-acetylase OafA/YrhL
MLAGDHVRKRYTFLDELRGIAALSVAVLHAAQIFPFLSLPTQTLPSISFSA